jgi:hypothetical protein
MRSPAEDRLHEIGGEAFGEAGGLILHATAPAGFEALWRTVSPNASLDASCRRLGFDIAFLCDTARRCRPNHQALERH